MKPQTHIRGLAGVVLAGFLFSFDVNSQCSISTNLVPNGTFESGNSNFTSSYGYNPGNLYPEGKYDVVSNPTADHAAFATCGDKTSGSGKMMVVNGAPTANVSVWCSTISTTANSDYVFSTYVASVHASSPAILQFSINGVSLGSPFNASGTTCNWQQFCQTWNSGASTSANICIVNQNTAASGNDFALDDIKMGIVAPLYVEMLGFYIKQINGQTQLHWATVTEIDHDYFSVERSSDMSSWESISVIEGKGNKENLTIYDYTDIAPLMGKSYYRLKMVDIHGIEEFSAVRVAKALGDGEKYKIYPNPTFSSVNLLTDENVEQVELVNAMGSTIYSKKVEVMQPDLAFDFSGVSQGIYMIRLMNKGQVVYTDRLIKK